MYIIVDNKKMTFRFYKEFQLVFKIMHDFYLDICFM